MFEYFFLSSRVEVKSPTIKEESNGFLVVDNKEKGDTQKKETTDNNLIKVGFAAETENLVSNAQKKLVEKKLDIVAANDVSLVDSGFESANNKIILFDKQGGEEDLGMLTKYQASTKILDKIKTIINSKSKRN